MTRPHSFADWRKASRSEPDGNCLEMATTVDHATVGIRDTKAPGQVLAFHRSDWETLLGHVRRGELDF